MTILLVIFCWLNPSYQNQSVLAQTPDQNTPNLQKQENPIHQQSLETQQLEKPEFEKETIDIGVSIGYNTFVVTALALLITILSIVLTIFIFVIGFLGYSQINKFKKRLETDEQNLADKIKQMDEQLLKAQNSVNTETQNLRKMIDNINDDFKKYIQAEASKMQRLGMVDYHIQMKNFEQALEEIEEFFKKYANENEEELLKRYQINKASILCNQEYASTNYDLALKTLEELLDWAEYKIEIYNLMAYCYSQKYYDSDCQETDLLKQAKEKLKQLEKIIAEENKRENFKLKINLGNYEIHLGNFKMALQYFYDADSCIDGINSKNSPSEFYLWQFGKLICYSSCVDRHKTELNQEFQKFVSNIDEWNEGLKYCKKNFSHLDKYLKKLEEEFEKFKQGETT